MKKHGRVVAIVIAAPLIFLVVWAFLPEPVKVEKGRVQRGALRVTVEEEAETRVPDRFEIATPVTGRLRRIELHAADPIESGQTLAQIEPLPLDPRERAELLARFESARASWHEADALVERTRAEYEQARRNRDRASKLGATGVISRENLELAETAEAHSKKALEAARFKARAAAYEVEVTKAGLVALAAERGDIWSTCDRRFVARSSGCCSRVNGWSRREPPFSKSVIRRNLRLSLMSCLQRQSRSNPVIQFYSKIGVERGLSGPAFAR
jgi:HlyD family secretion protein